MPNLLSGLFRRLFSAPAPLTVRAAELAQPKPKQEQLDDFKRLLPALRRSVPEEIRPAFEDAVRSYQDEPVNGPELLDAIDKLRTNLGLAIGRGATGQDERYEELGRVGSWLYNELGQPQNTSYAVVERAVRTLEEREREHGRSDA